MDMCNAHVLVYPVECATCIYSDVITDMGGWVGGWSCRLCTIIVIETPSKNNEVTPTSMCDP